MEKEHKIKVRWTAEPLVDLAEMDNPAFQEMFNQYLVEGIIEDFGSLQNFYDYCNTPKTMSVKKIES